MAEITSQDLTHETLLQQVGRMQVGAYRQPALGGIPLLAKIGQGENGACYRAVHPTLDCEVAVKVMPCSAGARSERFGLFLANARNAMSVTSPRLVKVFDVGTDADVFFQVMEYINGISAQQHLTILRERLKPGMDEGSVLDMCLAAAEGLAAAHAAGFVHRDIRPSSIIIPRGEGEALKFNEARLADLGLAFNESTAKMLESTKAETGTPGYMSPEEAIGSKDITAATDVFSIGATMYGLLVGQPPFGGPSLNVVLSETVVHDSNDLRTWRPDVSRATAKVIEGCLKKGSAQRFPNGTVLKNALAVAREAFNGPVESQADAVKQIESLMPSVAALDPAIKKYLASAEAGNADTLMNVSAPEPVGVPVDIPDMPEVVQKNEIPAPLPVTSPKTQVGLLVPPAPAPKAENVWEEPEEVEDGVDVPDAPRRGMAMPLIAALLVLGLAGATAWQMGFLGKKNKTVAALTPAQIAEQNRLAAEAKAKADAEAKAKEDALKKEADEKAALAEAEAKKAEADKKKAKEEADAKALADAEKAKEEAEAKTKADAEAAIAAKTKAEADAKAKAEEEKRLAAEAKAKEEAAEIAEAEARKKAAEEQKVAAAARAKEEAAKKEAEAKLLAEARAKEEANKHTLTPAEVKAKAELERRAQEEAKKNGEKEASGTAHNTAAPAIADMPKEMTVDLGEGVTMDFVLVPSGTFMMGTDRDTLRDISRKAGVSDKDYADEVPAHKAVMGAYYVGKYPVTVGQFRRYVAATQTVTAAERKGEAHTLRDHAWQLTPGACWSKPGFDQDDTHPVVMLSWSDCAKFCEWAAQQSGKPLRLPTEAEWEYAARGPLNMAYPWGNSWDGKRANHSDDSFRSVAPKDWYTTRVSDGFPFTSPVGALNNKSWCGAFDMAGNVYQWCQDAYAEYPTSPNAPEILTDPADVSPNAKRVLRGGSYLFPPMACRGAARRSLAPKAWNGELGMRVAFTPATPAK
jgi:formylglycine-generating enzyme required for sulfatase activity/serine/threonine protein kinase